MPITSSSIGAVSKQFKLHERVFVNAIKDITPADWTRQIVPDANHMAWLAGHTVNVRYNQAKRLGIGKEFPYNELFTLPDTPPPSNRAVSKDLTYPSVGEIIGYWQEIGGIFLEKLEELKEEELFAETSFATPIDGVALLDLYTFIAHHEAYTIGQLGQMRRLLGYKGLSYKAA